MATTLQFPPDLAARSAAYDEAYRALTNICRLIAYEIIEYPDANPNEIKAKYAAQYRAAIKAEQAAFDHVMSFI